MNQLKNIQSADSVDNNSKKKTNKTILRKWCELHVLDHHKFILLDSFNQCYYLYEKKLVEFKPHHFEVEETKAYYLCNCKKTKNSPFCDGSHN